MPKNKQTNNSEKTNSTRQASKPIAADIATQPTTHAASILPRAKHNPRRLLSTREVIQLQRTIGNQATHRLLARQAQQQTNVDNNGHKGDLPDNLKTGIEALSGYSMDDVRVHYNSSKPAQLKAHAYAQGSDIHVGPSQEKHLPHEAWHVVQQKQGRVKPTLQMKEDVRINDDMGLEEEADVMGAKAAQLSHSQPITTETVDQTVMTIQPKGLDILHTLPSAPIQLVKFETKTGEEMDTEKMTEDDLIQILFSDELDETNRQIVSKALQAIPQVETTPLPATAATDEKQQIASGATSSSTERWEAVNYTTGNVTHDAGAKYQEIILWDIPEWLVNGYIVQHVVIVDSQGTYIEYWEAWEVANSQFKGGDVANGTDQFTMGPFASGRQGVLSGYAMATTSMAPATWGSQVSYANGLPSTTEAPGGWSDSGATSRIIRYQTGENNSYQIIRNGDVLHNNLPQPIPSLNPSASNASLMVPSLPSVAASASDMPVTVEEDTTEEKMVATPTFTQDQKNYAKALQLRLSGGFGTISDGSIRQMVAHIVGEDFVDTMLGQPPYDRGAIIGFLDLVLAD